MIRLVRVFRVVMKTVMRKFREMRRVARHRATLVMAVQPLCQRVKNESAMLLRHSLRADIQKSSKLSTDQLTDPTSYFV